MSGKKDWRTIGRKLPRVPFGHSIITPRCRDVQTDALMEAVERFRAAYDHVATRNPDAEVHVLAVVVTPKDYEAAAGDDHDG